MDWIEFEMTIDIMVPKIECKKIDLILYLVNVFIWMCVWVPVIRLKKTNNIQTCNNWYERNKVKTSFSKETIEIWFREQFYRLIISQVSRFGISSMIMNMIWVQSFREREDNNVN